jgi:hypothetical protein
MPNLCQLTTLKTRLGITVTDNDAILSAFIKLVSARFERECLRTFERTEDFTQEFSADYIEIPAACFPIESVSAFELKDDELTGWQTQSDTKYLVRHGCIITLLSPLGSSFQWARVTYTGGHVLPGDTPGPGQTPLPDDLEQACVEQCASLFQNRERLGLVRYMEGSSLRVLDQPDLLPSVRRILETHTRQLL